MGVVALPGITWRIWNTFLAERPILIMNSYQIKSLLSLGKSDNFNRGPKQRSGFPVGIYLLKVNNRNTKRCEICSKLTIKTPE